jgi:hypothetical protein
MKLKQIAVNESNYKALKELGHAGDPFDMSGSLDLVL